MARFFRRGKSKIVFLPAVATPAAPSRSEITAGTPLTPQICELGGFSFNNTLINTPDLNSTFTSTIPGEDTAAGSHITFYDDDAASTIRTALAKGTVGYILMLPYGDVPTKRCEVWPVTTTGVADEWNAANDPAKFKVEFGVSAVPTLSAVIPT